MNPPLYKITLLFAVAITSVTTYFYFSPGYLRETLSGLFNLPCGQKCWLEKFDAAIQERGIILVLQSLQELYVSNADFRRRCYGTALHLGVSAYQNFPDPAAIPLGSELLLCNYGFIHGYAETLFRETKDLHRVKQFCAGIEKRFKVESSGSEYECFRGAGRGAVSPVTPGSLMSNVIVKNDVRGMVGEALKVCEALAPKGTLRGGCVSGLFNRLGTFYVEGRHGLRVDKTDPLWLCSEQKELYRPHCYGNMHRVLNSLVPYGQRGNIRAAVRLYQRIYGGKNDIAISAAVWNLAYEQAESQIARENHAENIASCREVDPPFFRSCLQGFAVGLAKNGRPGYQHRAVIDFCKDALGASPPDYIDCLRPALAYLKGVYATPKFLRICGNIIYSLPHVLVREIC